MKVLEIKTKDLENNIVKLQKRAGDRKIIAVVKGNGYGLGLENFVEILLEHGINYLAVSSVEEAIELADKKNECNDFVFGGNIYRRRDTIIA